MRKFKFLILIMCALLLLSSCRFTNFDTNTILTAPQMNAANQEIQKTLAAAVGADYELVYPRSGNYQNAVISVDINGNGTNEAVCFYTSGQDKKVSFTVLEKLDGVWTAQSMSHSQSAAEIDRVDFFDYDHDGTKEIIVGWQYLLGDEKALEIFNYGDSARIESLFTGLYNNLIVFDSTLVTLSKNSTGKTASASLVGKSGSSVGIIGTASLNNSISGIINVQSAGINQEYSAIFIDEQLENSMFTTEVLTINRKGDIYNVSQSLNSMATRNLPVTCTDVDDNGIPEIPVEKNFPSYRNADKIENLYYIDWYGISETEAKVIMSAYTSTNEQFILQLADEWIDNITVQKDMSTDRQINFFMLTDGEDIPMFSLRVFSQQEFSEDVKSLGWQSFSQSDENLYAFRTYGSDLPEAFTVDVQKITQLFKILS